MLKVKKLFIIALVFMLTIGLTINVIYAEGEGASTSKAIDPLKEIKVLTEEKTSKGDLPDKAKTLGQTFTTIFKVAGVGIAVLMLIVLAMKYMFSAPGDKATIKKHAVVYIVGAVILFSVSGLMNIFEKFSGVIK